MSSETFELNCPFCDKLYKLPRDKVIKHAGKLIHCRKCGKPFSIPSLPAEEPELDSIAIAAVAEKQPVRAPMHEESAEVSGEHGAVVAEAGVAEPEPVAEHAASEQEHTEHAEHEPAEDAPAKETAPVAHAMAEHSELAEPPALSEYEAAPVHEEEVRDLEERFAPTDAESVAAMALSDEPPSYFGTTEIASESESPGEEPVHAEGEGSGEELAAEDHELGQPEAAEFAPEAVEFAPEAVTLSPETGPLEPLEAIEDAPRVEPGEVDAFETEVPAPPPPQVAVAAPPPPLTPPRGKRNERISVMPVFDGVDEEEEPAPRRRRFGKRAEAAAPAPPPAPPPTKKIVEPVGEPVVQEEPASATIEPPEPDLAQEVPALSSESVMQEPPTESPASPPASRGDELTPESLRSGSTINSGSTFGMPVGVRRAVMLLAVMSVVITVVLIAILLAIIGVIPHR